MPNWFIKEPAAVIEKWDGCIHCKTVVGETDVRELTEPLPCGDGFIPKGYRWDGASVGILRYAGFLAFPRWKHPIASCRHDWRCEKATTRAERHKADKLFMSDIADMSSRWEKFKGYAGVTVGAWFGIGTNYK
jgi:hypothetical protein